jgi:hydrogenase maturation protease
LTVNQKKCDSKDILILGLGNILLQDEGIGVHVVEQLRNYHLPKNVDLIDGGTASLDVFLTAQDIDKLIIIDALKKGGKAGTIYQGKFKTGQYKQLEHIFSHGSGISLHQVGLIDALAVAEKMNCAPKEIVIIGIEPDIIDYGLELTEQLKQKISKIVDITLKEIENAVYTE